MKSSYLNLKQDSYFARITLIEVMMGLLRRVRSKAYEILMSVLPERISDSIYLKRKYRAIFGQKLNLLHPKKYTEKIQWLKIFYRDPLWSKLIDKYDVKQVVKAKIGEEYVIPCYGVWNSFDEIDFDTLPDEFVLKGTHDSGVIFVCTNKNTFDYEAARTHFAMRMKWNHYYVHREWAYKNVKPRIIAEKYIPSLGKIDSLEYKITCFNGEVKFITVCNGVGHGKPDERFNDHFNKQWEKLDWAVYYHSVGRDIPRPVYMDKLIELTEVLCEDVPQVRMDWFYADGKLYFGEFTFYSWGGFAPFDKPEWDEIIGGWFNLPKKK